MPTFKIGGVDAITQSNDDIPVIPNSVLNNSVTALDTTASNGATSNADNTALPLFGCRAFVNFDGTSATNVTVDGATEAHCTIRASGNVSKVVKSDVGNYVIHFTTAMPDTNYCTNLTIGNYGSAVMHILTNNSYVPSTYTTLAVEVKTAPVAFDMKLICITIFR